MNNMFKVGDRLKCKIQSKYVFTINDIYEIESIFKDNNIEYCYLKREDDLEFLLSESQIFDYFNANNIIRRRKLEQLNSL